MPNLLKLQKKSKKSLFLKRKIGENKRGRPVYDTITRDNFPEKTIDPLYAQLKEMAAKARALDSKLLELANNLGGGYHSQYYMNGVENMEKVIW